MNDHIKEGETSANWYYVIVQNPGSSAEQFVGYSDSQTDEKFIPAFKSKEEAQACFTLMPKDLFNGAYDTQAVIVDDLITVAEENGHNVYILDEKGSVLEHLK